MTKDPLQTAVKIVEAYLERAMIPDPEGAAAYLAPDVEIVFTGGRQFNDASGPPRFNAKRYGWVKKRFLRSYAARDPETGDVYVYNTGYLYGEWPDGTPFDHNRYIDLFVLKGGKIISTHVWNDSAEILPNHGRYDYSAITDRSDFCWPGGKRLAVYLGVNL